MGEDRRERRRVRLTLREAATRMGISKDAVRQRVRRGTIQADKGEDGRVYVYVDETVDTDQPELDIGTLRSEVRVLREQVEWMRAEAQRKDAILLNMTEAMKALSPPESPGPPDTPHETTEDPQTGTQRPWWRRMFGG